MEGSGWGQSLYLEMQPVGQAIFVLLSLVTPFVIFGVSIHWLERVIQTQLSKWFGWRAVLVTGWLGTPIHELSHAAACLLFNHRIEEMRLFDPDIKAGRLGYIRHSYPKNHWWSEIGNVFIGTAPLVGGSVMLVALMTWFYPAITWHLVQNIRESSWQSLEAGLVMAIELVWKTVQQVAAESNWLSWKPWLFLYFALCIGSHSAPSRGDYAGALKGSLLLVGLLLPLTSVLMIFVADPLELIKKIIAQCLPLWAMMLLVIGLTGLVAGAVGVATLGLSTVQSSTSLRQSPVTDDE